MRGLFAADEQLDHREDLLLGDRPSRLCGGVNEHRAGKHELLDPVEATLQRLQEAAGALDAAPTDWLQMTDADWLARYEPELDNLRAALAWATYPDLRLRMAGALCRFWVMRGYYTEGRSLLEGALKIGDLARLAAADRQPALALTDTNNDGVADTDELLVEGLGFDLKFRGADHTTNGMQMGIDGWLYIAVGDYGFVAARTRKSVPSLRSEAKRKRSSRVALVPSAKVSWSFANGGAMPICRPGKYGL